MAEHELICRVVFSGVDAQAQAEDLLAQIHARMQNTTVGGVGSAGERTSYVRHEADGALVSMRYVDTFGIVREGEYVAPPNEYPIWVAPTGGHDSYPAIDLLGNVTRVEHNLRVYENTYGEGNSFEPGTTGWLEIEALPGAPDPEPAGYPAWTPWTSGLNEDLHQIGDRVSHIDKNWEATLGNNFWEPGSGTGWVEIP